MDVDTARASVKAAANVRKSLHRYVPPRVVHAVLISWCNGWCTTRRFQQQVGPCRLCNLCNGKDELEHYTCCPYLWQSLPLWAKIKPEPRSLRRFLLLDLADDDNLAVNAVLVFAAYGAFNSARASDNRLSAEALRLMIQERFRMVLQDCNSKLRQLFRQRQREHH